MLSVEAATGRSPVPPEASWIEVKAGERDCRVTPENLLTAEDVKAMIRETENERDKALPNVLYEAALRSGELLTMKIGSVEFKDNCHIITVNGKTGLKSIPLLASCRWLLEWLEKHPMREDAEAPLWVFLRTTRRAEE
jgi:integrase